jgi:sugar lactone lactonase YvrE
VRRLLVLVLVAVPAAPAAALEPCPGEPARTTVLLEGQDTLESVIVDRAGRLFFTSPQGLMRLDARDGQPRLLTPIAGGGGLAFDADGMLLVGQGNTIPNGSHGDRDGPSSLLKIDPESGRSSVFATGLSMGNGLVRAPDGAFYASNDMGHNIDRIAGGKTQRGWAQVESGNGLAIDLAGRYLYAAQTFRPAAIARVDLRDPTKVTTFAAPSDPGDLAAGLDGMVRDGAGRLFVAANGAGQLWRAGTDGSLCLLVDGLATFPDGPSAVAVGRPVGTFGPENLYVVTFGGQLIEVAGAAVPAPRLALRGPRSACRAATFTARSAGKPVAGVEVRFGGHSRRTGPAGRARFRAPLGRPGRRVAVAAREGYETGRTRVLVTRC